jgi:hypothetical protein
MQCCSLVSGRPVLWLQIRTPLIYAHKKLPAGNIDARPRQPMTVALGSGGIYEILAAGAGSAKDEVRDAAKGARMNWPLHSHTPQL